MKNALLLILIIAQAYALFGQNCSPDSLINRTYLASETDSNIDSEYLPHQIYINPDCPTNNKLILHMVGTYDNPASTSHFPIMATNHGYKVISLKYSNWDSAVGTCGTSVDVNCFTNYRQELIYGTNVSTEVTIDSNECIMNRFLKLLIHLDNLHPSENWGHFLNSSTAINWSDIVLSGHSQGGGHAAFIAKQVQVDRVLMFASPNDYNNLFSSQAPWVSATSATPDSCYYAFGNLNDEIVDFSKQYQVWQAMNLLVAADSVDVDVFSTFNNSRVLYTKDTTGTGVAGSHNSVIIDFYTPKLSGAPVFIPVWEYMLGTNDIMSSNLNIETGKTKISLFPNPTKDKVFIKSGKIISKLEVYSFSGKLLAVYQPEKANFEVDLEAYRGMLLLRVSTADNKHKVLKVMVK